MTRNYKLGLHGRLLGSGLNGRFALGQVGAIGLAPAVDGRYRGLDAPTFLRRGLAVPGLRKRVA